MKENRINNKEPWLNKIQEKINNHPEPVPPFGWNQLEKELASPVARPIFSIKRHKWTIAAAAALLAAVSSVSLYLLHTPHLEHINQVAVEIIEQNPDKLLPIADVEKPTQIAQAAPRVNQTTSQATSKNKQANLTKAFTATTDKEVSTTTNDEGKEIANHCETEASPAPAASVDEASQERSTEQCKVTTRRQPSSKDKLHIPADNKKKSRKGTWSMGANIGNAGSISNNNESTFSGSPLRISLPASEEGIYSVPDNYTVIFNEGMPYMISADEVIHAKHHQPIAVGLTVRKNLKHGFSIDAGLNFTLLSSDISMAGDVNKTLKQKLYYLGIPIKANWNFIENKLFTLYVSAGGQIEKCVHGKLGNEKLTVKPLQFSVMGGVGAQFNITQRLGVYAEPGVAYFFKDGSDVQTIRKEHPFNFNMQAGVRFTY